MTQEIQNVRAIVQTALDLVEHGTFPGAAAPALVQTTAWLKSMLAQIEVPVEQE